jgi:cardiolipin synthase
MAVRELVLQGLAILHVALAVVFVIDLLRQHRSTAATIAWIVLIALLPYAGLLLYVVAGAPRKRSAALAEYFATHPQPASGGPPPYCADTERLLRALGLPGASRGNRVVLCAANSHAHAELLALIRGARARLYLQVFSFEDDVRGREIIAAMTERAASGVAVRVLVDDYGSLELGSAALRALVASGARLARYRPLVAAGTLRGAFNYRNHRKLAVADGRVAWIGGRNLARKYLEELPDGSHWADLSLVIAGPAAAVFESVFRSDWLTASGETLEGFAPAAVGAQHEPTSPGSVVQVLASGPDLPDDALHAMLLAGIAGARARVWIVSPFFVPDDALQSVLRLACRRGVDVRIVVPRRSNLWLADRVRASYLAELAAAGARVALFEDGVLHAKIVILDDRVALVGSANFDMRSLFTNHEVAAVLYSPGDIEAVAAVVEGFAGRSSALEPPARFATTALSGALRILAPLM